MTDTRDTSGIALPGMQASVRPPRRFAEESRRVSIVLNDAQIAEVLREVAGEGGLHGFLLGHVDDLARMRAGAAGRGRWEDDPRLSQSLLRALLILLALMPVGTERGVVKIADELGISPGTAHRYISTFKAVGLLEQSPTTRAYRLAAGGGG